MKLTIEQVQKDLDALSPDCKTPELDRLIRSYVSLQADGSALRPYVLSHQQFHRIYFYTALKQLKSAGERMAFIHENLLFSDWWHTDQLIGFVSELDFDDALVYSREYTASTDPFIRRWGYVLFISRLCRNRSAGLLPLIRDDEHYYVQMAQAWLIAELAVFEPEAVYVWMASNRLKYNINGKAVQKICDSYRITAEWKAKFKALRPQLKTY